jgi:hypothetical protein
MASATIQDRILDAEDVEQFRGAQKLDQPPGG